MNSLNEDESSKMSVESPEASPTATVSNYLQGLEKCLYIPKSS